MTTLTISNFSCIENATLELTPVVVIIGPQGSGKSVTTKLNYFFSDIPFSHIAAAERGDSLEDFRRSIVRQFREWFPPTAWGNHRFTISYVNGDFSLRVLRRLQGGKPSDEIVIKFSDWFESTYKKSLLAFAALQKNGGGDFISKGGNIIDPIERSWRIRESVQIALAKELGGEFYQSQTFIPAGRAFFTSIGRLVAGFENAGSLDPVTIRFAKVFAQLRDRNARNTMRSFAYDANRQLFDNQDSFMKRLFDGSFIFENEREYLVASDGRQIPLSSLSSGQQEIFPIWAMLDYFSQLDAIRSQSKRATRGREIIYIEEPEAHLFPSAQSTLLDFLFQSVSRDRRNMILTTHSPYIMGRLNVFLKAGSLSRRRKKNTEIGEVVPRQCWVTERDLKAYAIVGRKLIDIMDEDGLINSSYLDAISDDIGDDFSRLLEIEASI